MEFRIADTFSDSLGRLTSQEQKAVKTTAFDLQMNPAAPGHSFHKLDRAKDNNFWSVRVNADIRIIVHRTASSILLVYVDHHDAAYKWAERRKIECHPTTGAMQLVEVRERIEDVEIYRPKVIEPTAPAKPLLFDNLRKFELMSFGVPEEWVDDVRKTNEDTLFDVLPHLPQEAQENLLKLAVGESFTQPDKQAKVEAHPEDPFAHPDSQRRFRILKNAEELEAALNAPWEKWAVFLHPDQRQYVEKKYSGPVRISGSAGTGKTVVALHRAVQLAKSDSSTKILLTTFSDSLAKSLQEKVGILCGGDAATMSKIDVLSLHRAARSIYSNQNGPVNIITKAEVKAFIKAASSAGGNTKFSQAFLAGEWMDVVDAWQLVTWDLYKDVSRIGRKTRLGELQRKILWDLFEKVRSDINASGKITWPELLARATDVIAQEKIMPYSHIVIDEAQDLGVAEAKFIVSLAADRPEALFFAGDLGQRIFQQPFSWKSLGIDVRGRSFTLKVNYRTSHQIRAHADKLLSSTVSDVDGIGDTRKGTISVFDGPHPIVKLLTNSNDEQKYVANWLSDALNQGFKKEEIALFVRSDEELDRAKAIAIQASLAFSVLDADASHAANSIAISTMHNAKGLEYRAVAVVACDEDVLPQEQRIEDVADDADLEEVYNTERHLLYVACTRARERLLITGVSPGSEFLSDF